MKKLLLSLLCLAGMGMSAVAATTFTATITDKDKASLSNEAPVGVSVTYTQTYSTAKQSTGDNSATMTISGLAGYKVTKLEFETHSNSSKGAGSMTVTAGSTEILAISGEYSSVWSNGYTTSYEWITPSLSNNAYVIKTGENLVMALACTTNSLYWDAVKVTIADADEENEPQGPQDPLTPENNNILSFEDGEIPDGWTAANFTVYTSNGANKTSNSLSTNGQTTATLTSDAQLENVVGVNFYMSKTSSNKTAGHFYYIKGSTDGENFSQLAKSADIGTTISSANAWVKQELAFNAPFTGYLQIAFSGSTAVRLIDEIEIVFADGVVIAAPVITMDGDNMVTITCATADTDIYYTLDGTEPTKASSKYTAAFQLTAAATVKAVAYDANDNHSPVASKKLVPATPITSIADFIAAAPEEARAIEAPLTVLAQGSNKGNIWVKDATGYMQLYAKSFTGTYTMGNVIPAGVTGTYTLYQDAINEMVVTDNATLGASTSTVMVEPEVITLAELNNSYINHYVQINNVAYTATSISDGNNTVTARENNMDRNFEDADNANVTAIVGYYTGAIQLYPLSVTPVAVGPAPLCGVPTMTVNGNNVVVACENAASIIYIVTPLDKNGEPDEDNATIDEVSGNTVTITLTEPAFITVLCSNKDGVEGDDYCRFFNVQTTEGEGIAWVRVESQADLTDGTYVIGTVKSGSYTNKTDTYYFNYVVGAYNSTNKRYTSAEATYSDDHKEVTPGDGATMFTIAAATGENTYTIVDGGKYVTDATSGNKYTMAQSNDEATATITIDDAAADIRFANSSESRWFSTSVITTYWSVYADTSTQYSKPALYKKTNKTTTVTTVTPVVDVPIVGNVNGDEINYNVSAGTIIYIEASDKSQHIHMKHAVYNPAASSMQRAATLTDNSELTATNDWVKFENYQVQYTVTEADLNTNTVLMVKAFDPVTGADSEPYNINIRENGEFVTGIEAVEASASQAVEYFDMQGRRVAAPAQGGIYIRRSGNDITKVVIK